MTKEVFDKLIIQLEIGCGSFPALTGHHLSKEQFEKINNILQKRKENIDNYLNRVVKCRLLKR
jgi:hypothetical protein